MKKIKQCRICGKESNSYYCCKKHMALWYRNNPRHLKVCECCGNEFKTNDKTQKYCSRECCGKGIASIVSEKVRATALKQSTQLFIETFNSKVGTSLEYISGYTGCDSIIKARCKKCYTVFSYGAQFLRKDKKPNCPHCLNVEREQREQNRLNEHRLMAEVKAKEKQEKKILEEQALTVKRTIKCNQCGKTFLSFNGKVYCSDKCKRKYLNHKKDITRRHKLLENGKVDYSITLEKLIPRDKNRCHICGSKCNINDYVIDNNGYFIAGDDYPSIDHLNPVAKGGAHTWDNIKLAHRGCNNAKSDNDCFIKSDGQVVLSI